MFRFVISVLALLVSTQATFAQDAAAPTDEPEQAWSVNLNASVVSAYMFRGQNYYDGMSFQPSIAPSYSLGEFGNFSGLLWMHIPADGDEDSTKFLELDQGLTYDYTYNRLTFSLGHYWYTYPNKSDHIQSSREAWGSVSVDTMLAPTFAVYSSYDLYDYLYYEANFHHTLEQGGEDAWNLTLFSSFGFASHADKVYADDGFVQATIGTSTDFTVGNITVTPTLSQSIAADDNAVDKFWMGLAANYSF